MNLCAFPPSFTSNPLKAYLRLKNKWGLDNQLIDQMAEARGQVAIHTAYNVGVRDGSNKVDVLHPLPPAGITESADYREKHPNPVTNEEVVSNAKEAAAAKMKEVQSEDSSTASILKKIEETKAGLTLRLTTGEGTRDISTQHPGIQLVREKGDIDGTIETLPLRGESWTQTFNGKRLGKFLGVRLLAEEGEAGRDGWHIQKMEAQDGFGKEWQTMVPVTCDGLVRENVWLNSVGNKVANFSYTAHLGGSSHAQGNDQNVAAATHASGAAADGAPKWYFVPEGTPVPACSDFVQKPVAAQCRTTCGHAAETVYGDVPCLTSASKSTTTDDVCTFWEKKKPEPLTKQCPATEPCVEYKKSHPKEECDMSCGFKGDTKTGKVWCQEVVSGKEVGDGKCNFWGLKKPATPTEVCKAQPSCVQWATEEPQSSCQTKCGFEGETLVGESFCKESEGGKRVADAECLYNGLGSSNLGAKPPSPKKACPKTKVCAKWTTVEPTDECTSTCGFKGDTKAGSVVCTASESGSPVADSICDHWNLAKPPTPSKECPAAESCLTYQFKTPADLNKSCPTQCDHPESTLTGSVECCDGSSCDVSMDACADDARWEGGQGGTRGRRWRRCALQIPARRGVGWRGWRVRRRFGQPLRAAHDSARHHCAFHLGTHGRVCTSTQEGT